MAEQLLSLISGGGTTMEQNALRCFDGRIPMKMAGVIASSEITAATGIKRAEALGLKTIVVDPERFRGDNGEIDMYGFGQALNRARRELGGTQTSQNGWLPKTPLNFIEEDPDSIYNQHPGPKYETRATHGMQPHAIMIYLARHTGRNDGTDVIIHRVNENWDDGPEVGRKHVPIYLPYDTASRLQKRALKSEYDLQEEHWNNVVRGNVVELQPLRYIRQGERKILLDARKHAREVFPEG